MCDGERDGDEDEGTTLVTENVERGRGMVEEAWGQEGEAGGIEEDTVADLSYDFVGIYPLCGREIRRISSPPPITGGQARTPENFAASFPTASLPTDSGLTWGPTLPMAPPPE
jgi:hypothetical protein